MLKPRCLSFVPMEEKKKKKRGSGGTPGMKVRILLNKGEGRSFGLSASSHSVYSFSMAPDFQWARTW